MKDPAGTLIPPFKAIWESLAAQSNNWSAVLDSLAAAQKLPSRLHVIREGLTTILGDASKLPFTFGLLEEEAKARRSKVTKVMTSDFEAFVYPYLVGSWSVVEAAIEDLALLIVKEEPQVRDSSVVQKLKAQLPGADENAEEFLMAVTSRMQQKHQVVGSVVKSHAAFLAALGVPFQYNEQHAGLIEEINQVRNCILHRQGQIDSKAVKVAPRLAKYLGKRIPANDELFTVFPTMLQNYTFTWLQALVFSDYLKAGLKPGVKNPHDPEG